METSHFRFVGCLEVQSCLVTMTTKKKIVKFKNEVTHFPRLGNVRKMSKNHLEEQQSTTT
jgi:hypothetical protein